MTELNEMRLPPELLKEMQDNLPELKSAASSFQTAVEALGKSVELVPFLVEAIIESEAENEKLREGIKTCKHALEQTYAVIDYPANGESQEDDAIRLCDNLLKGGE